MITMIKKNMIEMMWPDIEPLVSMALEHGNGEMSADQLKERLLGGHMAIAMITESGKIIAAVTFEQREFPSGKRTLNVVTGGGTAASDWIDEMNDLCEHLAKEHNCDEIYIIGRPGWVKKVKHLGFELIHTTISRKVGV